MCRADSQAGDILQLPIAIAGERTADGRGNALVAGIALLANTAADSAVSPLLLAIGSLALLARAGIPAGVLLRRLAAPWYFATVAFLVQLFLSGQTPLFQIGPLLASEEGLARGILLASKIVGGTAIVIALSLTTPVAELLAVAAWLRVPPALIEIATLIYRYLFLLIEEAHRAREAQVARLGYDGWRRSLASCGQLGGLVLVNAYGRAERVYEAMLLRGYSGYLPTQAGAADVAQVLTGVLLSLGIAAIFLLGWLL